MIALVAVLLLLRLIQGHFFEFHFGEGSTALTKAGMAQKIADDCGAASAKGFCDYRSCPHECGRKKDANCKAPENDSPRFSFL